MFNSMINPVPFHKQFFSEIIRLHWGSILLHRHVSDSNTREDHSRCPLQTDGQPPPADSPTQVCSEANSPAFKKHPRTVGGPRSKLTVLPGGCSVSLRGHDYSNFRNPYGQTTLKSHFHFSAYKFSQLLPFQCPFIYSLFSESNSVWGRLFIFLTFSLFFMLKNSSSYVLTPFILS